MKLKELQNQARHLGGSLQHLSEIGVHKRGLFDQILRDVVELNTDIFGTWCVWEPNAFDGKDQKFCLKEGHDASGRFIPFWRRRGSEITVEPNTNYDHPRLGGYLEKPRISGSELTMQDWEYHSVNGDKMLLTCHVVPLFRKGIFVAAVGIDALPEYVDGSNLVDDTLMALSKREMDVLNWVAQAKSNAEIALILGISLHTVKRHMENILRKLGVENRQAAALSYLERQSTMSYRHKVA
jgi:DNA-binding CsgD family transcriptional regulator